MSTGGIRLESMTSWLDEFGYDDPGDRERYLTYWHDLDVLWRHLRSQSDDKGKHIPVKLPDTWGEIDEED